jgi:hypothetical protein
MKLSQVIAETIRLARAIPRRQAANPNGKKSVAVRVSDLSPPPPPTTEEECLHSFLLGQPAAVVYAVMTVMYLGRGDYDKEFDFPERYAQLSDTFHKPQWAVSQMINKSLLADYLERGMRLAARLGIDVDDVFSNCG